LKPHRYRRPAGSRPIALLLIGLGAITPGVGAADDRPGGLPAASTPAKTARLADLANRYRFSERYAPEGDRTPGAIGPYRVGVVEVVRDSIDTAQGAPKRSESSRQTIFVERPAEVAGPGGVASASARTYERFIARPDDPTRAMGGRPMVGLSVAVRPRVGDLPTILSLTGGRRLTEYEYDVAARQVFLPHLAGVLPAQSVRIGDVWRVPRRATQAIVGEVGLQGDTLVGAFSELRKEVEGPRMVAVLRISGRVTGPTGDTAVNAEALFTFQPQSPAAGPAAGPSAPSRPAQDVVEAVGAITEIRMGRVTTGPIPGPGRLRFQSSRELTVHRQLGLDPVGAAQAGAIPDPTEANSWLAYVAPSGRFAFDHPQDMVAPPDQGPAADPNVVTRGRKRREGTDMLRVEFVAKAATPEVLKAKLDEIWGQMKMEVIKGDEAWLPEVDWPRMKAHRIEASVKVADPRKGGASGSSRIHFDGYLVQVGPSASVLAIATTSRDAVIPFRTEVEKTLKSIQIDPPRPAKE